MNTTCTATLMTTGQQLATAVARPRGKPLGFFLSRASYGRAPSPSSSSVLCGVQEYASAPPLRRHGSHPISCALSKKVFNSHLIPFFRAYCLTFVLVFCFFGRLGWVVAGEVENSVSVEKPWAKYVPYVPEKNEYFFEMGGQWERENLSWFGLGYGRYLSPCWNIKSERCQQYLDFTLGVGHVMGTTEGLFLVGPRWQYVMFPKPFSPSFQVFTGAMNIRDSDREKTVVVYGMGAGLSMTLHKKLTMKWDNRLGGGDQFWYQSMITFSLKIDDWVDQFGDQMKKIGHTTVETTGTILKSPKTLMDWFNRSKEPTTENNPENK